LRIFEIGLGVVILTWRDEFGPVFYLIATVWAFLGAFVLLREALQKRAETRQQKIGAIAKEKERYHVGTSVGVCPD
jgi:hypothetical protein